MVFDRLSVVTIAGAVLLPMALQSRLEPDHVAQVDGRSAAAVLSAPIPAPVEPGGGALSSYRIARARDGMFYVTARINDRPVRLMVDTGASMVVLSHRDASSAGLTRATLDYSHTVQTVSGAAQVAPVAVAQMDVAGRVLTDVDAAVIEDGLGVSLLGQNALKQLSSLSIEGDYLTIR